MFALCPFQICHKNFCGSNQPSSIPASRPLGKLAALLAFVVLMGGLRLAAQAQPEQVTQADSGQDIANNQTSASEPAPPGLVHIVPFGRNRQIKQQAVPIPVGSKLQYWGGPVISQVHVVAVFWGPNVNPAITAPGAIDQFFTDITQSRYYDLLTEYGTVGVTGVGVPATSSNQSINRGVFDGKFTISPTLCAAGPCSITDAQIQQELARQINSLALPQPVTDPQGNINTFYMIYFPPGVTISVGTDTSCVQFCAYHSNTDTPVTPRLVPYGVLPDLAAPSACSQGCGPGTTLFQNVTTVTSHELAEAVTDPLIGSASTTAPPLAWYDPDLIPGTNSPLAEIGDMCVGENDLVVAGGTTYAVQGEFSNLQGQCVSAPPIFAMNPPPEVAPGDIFDMTLTVVGIFGNFNLTLPYQGTIHFTSADPDAVLPADYTFTSADAGSHTFPITLNTLGDQTITVQDVRISGFNGTASSNVNTNPDMVITKSHIGDFVLGRVGTYTIIVSNNGQGPTNNLVVVTDTLPAGLTASAISGVGWNCILQQPVTCTRSDVLARGANYPAITLTVDVATNAPSFVVNSAAVSGGGETNAANDTAIDPTTIVPPPVPDLTVTKTHVGPLNGNFFQGETGATYTITVGNNGAAPTTGIVTLVDTLPAGQLTATAMSGAGWNCILASLACTRSDALQTGASYPPITLTVDVALTASPVLSNVATASGGGETNTSNDTVQDLTIIAPPPGPDLTATKTHPFFFLQGQTGVYTITVSNIGTSGTTAPVTVTDNLPAGLAATAISGTGWTCDLPSLTCSRSDVLNSGASYPSITLNVNVDANAPSNVTNTAAVSGGGDTNPNLGNNSAADPTQIRAPVVDMTIGLSSPAAFFQGEIGGTMTMTVFNVGTIPSVGSVTATANLPAGMTATGISGPGWSCTLSTLACTRSDALNANSPPYPDITLTVDVVNNAPATLTATAAVSGGGDTNPTNNTTGSSFSIVPAVRLIGAGSTTATISSGQSAVYSFQIVTTVSAGSVTFSCAGLPTGATCSFNPLNIFPSVITPVAMTVSTTARSGAVNPRLPVPDGGTPWLPLLVPAGLIGIGLSTRLAGRTRLKPLFSAVGIFVIALLAGCGGNATTSSVRTPNTSGTPAGTYSVTMTALGSSAGSATQAFTLVVK